MARAAIRRPPKGVGKFPINIFGSGRVMLGANVTTTGLMGMSKVNRRRGLDRLLMSVLEAAGGGLHAAAVNITNTAANLAPRDTGYLQNSGLAVTAFKGDAIGKFQEYEIFSNLPVRGDFWSDKQNREVIRESFSDRLGKARKSIAEHLSKGQDFAATVRFSAKYASIVHAAHPDVDKQDFLYKAMLAEQGNLQAAVAGKVKAANIRAGKRMARGV